MSSSNVPARCLFPDNSDSTQSLPVRRPASFSIGEIMKSVGLPAQEDVKPEVNVNIHQNIIKSQEKPELRTRPQKLELKDLQQAANYSSRGDLSGIALSFHQTSMTPELQLKDLLNDQQINTRPAHADNPFMSFLDKSPLGDVNRCQIPSFPLSLHHIQPGQELSPLTTPVQGFPFSSFVYPPLPSTSETHMKGRDKTTTVSPGPESTGSPSSDISENLIDVETTSPNDSSTSSGFCSNPSPTLSSTSSSSTESRDTEVPANQRRGYNDKQASRLKEVFEQNIYPDAEQYEKLSEELNIPVQRLRVWFQNRRARNKRRGTDTQMLTYPPHVTAMMSSAQGYMASSPMMHQSMYQYPVSPASMYPMYPMYAHNLYPGYPYPLQYKQIS